MPKERKNVNLSEGYVPERLPVKQQSTVKPQGSTTSKSTPKTGPKKT